MAKSDRPALERWRVWLRSWLQPDDIRVTAEVLTVLSRSIRTSVLGPFALFLLLATTSGSWRAALIVLGLGATYIVLVSLNHRRLQAAASSPPTLLSLARVIRLHVWTTAALACLVAVVPWIEFNEGDLQRHLFMSVAIVGYSVGFAFVHSVVPPAAMVYSTITSLSVAIFWLVSNTTAGTALALLIVLFNYFMIRSSISFAGMLRRTTRARFERDDALATAEENAAQLTDALVKIRQIDEEKIRLFSAANHDLRQPISAISLFVGALEMRVRRLAEPERGAFREIVGDIDRTVEILDQIVGSLSEITRLDSGGFIMRRRYVELAKLVRDAIVDLQAMARTRNCRLLNQVTDRLLHADPEVISRILRNLIDNAIKYAPGTEIRIHLESRSDGDWLCVSDRGPGIPDEKKTAVFEEYVQLNNPARDRSKGLGLGLPIAKRMATLADSEIRLADAPGGGLMAMLALRNLVINDAPLAASIPEPMPAAAPLIIDSLMLIDDDPDIRKALALILADEDIDLSTCGSAAEALQALAIGPVPDVILLDNWLPDSKGLDQVDALRALAPQSRIVLVTGDTDPKTREQAQSLGIPLLIKPITASKVFALIG